MYGHFKAGSTLNDWTDITTLPLGFRPSAQLRIRQSNQSGKIYGIYIGPDGAVQIYGASGVEQGDDLVVSVAY